MKFKNLVGVFFFIILSFNTAEIRAQNVESPQRPLSLNDKNSPFKDGETFIAEVKFLGLDSNAEFYQSTINGPLLFEEEFRQILYLNRFGTPFFPNWKINREKVKELIKLLEGKANTSGYLEAKVSATGEKLPDNQMRLIISVERGEVARVSEIRFFGNKNVPGAELIESLKNRDDYWTIFRKRQYKHYLDDSSLQLMFSKGFLQAKIKRIVPEKTSYGYIVTVEVEEGIRYRIGDIKIEGAKIFSEYEVLKMLDQNVGDIADGRDLKKFFEEKLKRSYADKGYIQYAGAFDADYVKPQAEGLDGVVNVRATINEGRVYKISKIDFWEIEESKAADLRRISGLKVNEIYSQSALEAALKNIDDTKEFEPTNIGFCVNLRANEDTGELEIEIALERKE